MAEQARQEENESRQADAPDQAERTEMAAQDEIQGPVAQPLLPPIQAAQSGHDQSQGPMQASSPQQQQQAYGNGNGMQQQQPQQQQPDQQQQQPHQHQQQQQQQLPVQSPTTSQSQYESRPQQSHYAQPPPVQQQHQHQQQPPPPPPPPPQQQQQQHQQQAPVAVQYEHAAPPQSNGAPPGYAPAQQIPPPHHNPYQYQQPAQYPQPGLNGDANGFPTQMRYSMPLPPNGMNAQQLSGTRHKKEIKRRTKTGCLTCRKRRIKCDEGHPTCRNCQKSKRECLGYDPIFKPQTGQPANIQPQPGSLGSLPPPPDSQSPQAPPPLAPHAHYSNIPQGYVPASSAGYAPAPAMQNQLDQGYDYGSAIDPALAAVHPAASHIPPPPMPPPQEEYSTILLPERNVRLITMDDAYHLDGIPPSFPPPRDPSQPIPQHQVDAVRDLYLREYAPGLDRFFETDWYGTQGLNLLMVDRHLLHYFAHCIERFQQPPSEQNKGLPSIEARLIWVLATMAMDPNQGPLAHVPRIEAVSHIILGTFMPSERVPPAPAPSSMPDPKTAPDAYAFYLQDLFWHHLSSFVTIRDDNSRSQSSGQEIANQLAGMRNILSMLENRDVLYSMAIARHFGGRMERYEPDKVLVGRGTEAEDPINKLVVAMGFLGNEEVQGTTQVVQRLCGMSRRAFLLQRLDSMSPNGHIQANGVHPMPPATT